MKITLIKPELTKYLPKVKHLTLGALVVDIFKRSLDLDESSCSLLKEEDGLSRRFAPQLSRLFREEFVPVHNIRKHVEQLDGFIQHEISLLKGTPRIQLEDWMFKCFVGSLGKLLWGGHDGPFGDPAFVSHLRKFLLNIQRLNNPVKCMVGKDLLESRRSVRQGLDNFSFDDYVEKCAEKGTGQPVEESFLSRIRSLCLMHGASADGWTDHQLLLIFGLVPNVMAASTWMIHHLLADPELMTIVRGELDDFVRSSSGGIDLAKGPEACPHLYALWYEVLRFHGGFTIGRYVHEDSTLAGEYLLKKGTFLLAPLRPHHFDPEIWGSDVDEFRHERFLTSEGALDYGPTKNLRVYGLFGSLCPGRFLAVHFAVVGIIRILLAFDITPVAMPHVAPDECKDTLVGLVTPAWDVEVDLQRRRSNHEPIRIIYDNIRQGT